MRCKYVKKILVDYVDEVLNMEDRMKVEVHFAECDSCLQEMRSLKKVMDIIHDVKIDYPPQSVWDNFIPDLHRRIEREAALEFSRQQKRRSVFMFAGTSFAITVLFMFLSLIILKYYPIEGSIRARYSKATNIQLPPLIEEKSEPVFLAGVISKVLIDDSEAAELEELGRFARLDFPSYYEYDETITDQDEESDKSSEKVMERFYIESRLMDFDGIYQLESETFISDSGSAM